MGNLIRRFGIACIAIVVAVSLSLSPANAVAMLDCDVQLSHDAAHDVDHAHFDAASVEQEADSATHPANHCVAHACVVAIEALSIHPHTMHLNHRAGFRMQSYALVAAAKPEGLRRPPRV
ncbi:hypothetical protein [Frigidibacter sp.]|uniref:hypothetical protein n=1 Tax=Frigidibacter sp. TaxID=2586418 RepID=UPI002732388E|nr:hypothetical protein [Frigidibacter sp.]MDP3340474.1 hypothetical protein [Frigidibacter sp.]